MPQLINLVLTKDSFAAIQKIDTDVLYTMVVVLSPGMPCSVRKSTIFDKIFDRDLSSIPNYIALCRNRVKKLDTAGLEPRTYSIKDDDHDH